ncbi:hypothetical protein AXG93_3348s1100 [Marchantia polymorpha subsp. ruderalis]|uniref:Uncharacterized protein n=3 Tax=Marchantia polymorpha TaxID=3197 RepID=A0A176VQ69_MARPO|nr:hypothetical protein AXG93_3348s1100 [Marchantia polymorpha subsp. ruderalis]
MSRMDESSEPGSGHHDYDDGSHCRLDPPKCYEGSVGVQGLGNSRTHSLWPIARRATDMEVEDASVMSSGSGAARASEAGSGLVRMESADSKRAKVVQSEVDRVRLLPASSAYAIHRLRVLNKMLDLLRVDPAKRTKTEVDELELLFAGMSF